MVTVAFQGERGAFSEDASIKLFGNDIDFLPCTRLKDVFQAVLEAKVSFGVVPIENSQAGSINETYDLLLAYPLHIYAEVILRVSHCLLALPGENLVNITKVYSHPQALAQCDEFLSKLTAEIIPVYDTAGSAKMIKERELRECAAIASRRAAEIYGLEVLAAEIETNINNYTKFFAISKGKAKLDTKNKTSLVFAARHVPGALYRALGVFATRNINLTKLESRPSKSKPWEYVFYVDFEGHLGEEMCQKAVEELRKEVTFLKILGSYPQAE
ncbi:MAG: bifunctional chorismate mutase/prephenate dehydratase [Dehalococcoidia bacterium CG2_30_46_9]|nr:MAG: bifunctional chorismate mutase/prephenate dehydratase [Dehalococcoidia bacterium CG2_30_46_9]